MKKLFLAFIFFGALGALFAAGEKPLVKIGVVMPMTGETGQALKDLVDTFQKRLPEVGSGENYRYRYVFVFEDSRMDPKTSHLAAMKLISVDHVNLIVSVAAMTARVIMPLAKEYHVPQLSIAGATEADGKWNFVYFLDTADEVKLSLSAMKALGIKSYGMLMLRQAGDVEVEKFFEKYRRDYGIEKKGVFYFNQEDISDYRPHLMRLKEKNPDIVFIAGTPAQQDVIFRQAHYLGGFDGKWTTLETFDDVVNKQDISGAWIAGCRQFTPEILKKFKAMGITPQLQYLMYAYDIPHILVDACEDANARGALPTGEELARSLAAMKSVETILGDVEQSNGFFAAKPVLVYYDENGVGREVSLDELKTLKGIK